MGARGGSRGKAAWKSARVLVLQSSTEVYCSVLDNLRYTEVLRWSRAEKGGEERLEERAKKRRRVISTSKFLCARNRTQVYAFPMALQYSLYKIRDGESGALPGVEG